MIVMQLKKESENVVIRLHHNMDFLKSNKHESTQDFINHNLERGMLPTAYKKEPVLIKSRDLCRRNIDALKQSLHNTNYERLIVADDVNSSFNNVHTEIVKQIDWFVPETQHMISCKKLRWEPWINAGLLNSINRSKKLYKNTLKRTCTEKDRSKYVTYNVMLRKIKRQDMNMYYHSKFSEYRNNTSKLWQTISEIVGKTIDTSGIVNHITVNGVTDNTANGIGNAFGKFFSGVGKCYAEKISKSKRHIDNYLAAIRRNKSSLFLTPRSASEIVKLLEGLPNKCSEGIFCGCVWCMLDFFDKCIRRCTGNPLLAYG